LTKNYLIIFKKKTDHEFRGKLIKVSLNIILTIRRRYSDNLLDQRKSKKDFWKTEASNKRLILNESNDIVKKKNSNLNDS